MCVYIGYILRHSFVQCTYKCAFINTPANEKDIYKHYM